jgi:uncharacterized protein GlcG (DUF336 family)
MFGVQQDEPARHIIKSAEAKAESLGCAMNTAVVDAGGNLVAHVRCAPGPSRTSWRKMVGARCGPARMFRRGPLCVLFTDAISAH